MTETNYCTNSNQAVLSLCDEFWQWRLNESPELATQCGLHQYDDRWDDLREEAYINREVLLLFIILTLLFFIKT